MIIKKEIPSPCLVRLTAAERPSHMERGKISCDVYKQRGVINFNVKIVEALSDRQLYIQKRMFVDEMGGEERK